MAEIELLQYVSFSFQTRVAKKFHCLWPEVMVPKTLRFSRFSSFSSYKNLFLCIYLPHFPFVNVSKYAFFAVNSTTYLKLLVGLGVNFIFHHMYLFFVLFFFRGALTLLVFYLLANFLGIELFFNESLAVMMSLFYKFYDRIFIFF